MDKEFLQGRLHTIAKYRLSSIGNRTEREIYWAHIQGLTNACWNSWMDINDALNYIDNLLTNGKLNAKFGFFVRKLYMLELACKDTKDVVSSMKRWEGTSDTCDPERLFAKEFKEMEKCLKS